MRQNALLRSEKSLRNPGAARTKARPYAPVVAPVRASATDHFALRNGVRCAGVHLIIDLHGAKGLDDIDLVEATLRRCVDAARATLLHIHVHHFQPNGISGVAVLAESHISIHTWPEVGLCRNGRVHVRQCQSGRLYPGSAGGVPGRLGSRSTSSCADRTPDQTSGQHDRGRAAVTRRVLPSSSLARLRGMTAKRWISETLFDDLGFRMTFAVDRVLYETQTEHQHLVLFEHEFFGKVLMLDGATQVTSKDEFIYHEMMTHVPILAHGHAREVLIIGGGDCGIAEEALKHASVKRLTQVEIDASVVEFSKEHFPEFTRPVLANPRFDLIIDDGMNYVAQYRTPVRCHHRQFDRSAGSGQGAVQRAILSKPAGAA